MALQAERRQQSQEKMSRERHVRLSVAESNMQQIVAQMEEEEAQAAVLSRSQFCRHMHLWTEHCSSVTGCKCMILGGCRNQP